MVLISIFGRQKTNSSSELLNQSKIFSQNQKLIASDQNRSVYNTLDFRKTEQIFKTNAFISQEAYFKNSNFLQPTERKVF